MCPGCGPTNEEIMAREQARLERETRARAEAEAKRQAEEARLARIRATETAGDEAARQGELKKALENYQDVLKNVQRYSKQDQRVRQAVIKVVQAMPAPPPLPESVFRSMVRGETKLKMGGTGSYEAAALEMEQAVLEAPWFADGYCNLGVVQEKADKFGQAAQDFRLCLSAAPKSRNAAAIQAKVYALEVMQEEHRKMHSLQGAWHQEGSKRAWTLKVEGKKILLQSRRGASPSAFPWSIEDWMSQKETSIQVEKEGRSLNGLIHFDAATEKQLVPAFLLTPAYIRYGCTEPAETEPISGTISEDGRALEFRYQYAGYSENCVFSGSINGNDLNYCGGIAVTGKKEASLKLVRGN
jgi:tetratricopeptide (TPR) repeat protein